MDGIESPVAPRDTSFFKRVSGGGCNMYHRGISLKWQKSEHHGRGLVSEEIGVQRPSNSQIGDCFHCSIGGAGVIINNCAN